MQISTSMGQPGLRPALPKVLPAHPALGMKVALQTHQILQGIAEQAFQRLFQNWYSGSGNRKIGNSK